MLNNIIATEKKQDNINATSVGSLQYLIALFKHTNLRAVKLLFTHHLSLYVNILPWLL